MELLVLGPLEARSGRESLPLGGPRQRAVLADLVLHGGSVVAMDTLIDDLWGAEPPPTAEAVVQNAVSRLRKTLGRDVIETRPPGYLLAVGPGAIDARRFERLVRDARPLPPAERSAALRDALALWRGSAFSDLAFESFLQDEIARLDELRLSALEERLDAELELRRHAAVVPEASVLVDQHPARERLCRILMLAFYRAGRQTEALDAYQTLRRTLDELFGIEPSPETKALQLLILKQDPALDVTPEPPTPRGAAVRRPVALLAVELLLDEELELEVAGSALEDARRALAEVAARHGGSLSHESGVELIAAFGAEAAYEDNVLRAARSAVELHEMLTGRELEARLAVGTGRLLVEDGRPVLVGAVVAQTRRALQDADAGDILVTPAAARLGGDALELDADGRLHGVRPGRPSTISSAPLVGRSAELAGLRAAFDRIVETGRPQHAVVVGEAGIGKSRLVAAFVGETDAVVLEAACVPYGAGISFLPLRELAETAAALDENAPELGDLSSADAALAAARALCEHFTTSGPLVVALDDLHWAVPTFLDLVEYVVRAVRGPLLVVSATRPELLEQRPAWGVGATRLEPLGGGDARCLVDALPEREALDDAATRAILDAAEGVPLFLEQLAAHAAESDLRRDWIPSSLDALLASRIDALEPGERVVLQRAAVVGRTFSRESIGALTPAEERPEIDGRLASLGRRRFVRSHPAEREFVHPLVRRAAYGAIGRAERAGMHATFARWLDEQGENDELVGTHLERSARDTRPGLERDARSREASSRLGRVGQRALLAFDHVAAANLLGRAAALREPGDADGIELDCSLGHALKGMGEFDRAVELLQSAAERARSSGERRLEVRAQLELVYPLLVTGSLTTEDAVELLEDAVVVLEESGDTLGLARAESTLASVIGAWAKHANAATPHYERADQAFQRIGLVGYLDVSRVSSALHGATPIGEAIELCEECLARHPDRPRRQAYLRAHLALLRALNADLEGARELVAAACSELRDLGEELGLGTWVASHLGSIEALARDWPRAHSAFEAGLEYTRDRPSQRSWHAYFLARLGEVALGRADAYTAGTLADQARTITVAGDVETEIWWRRVSARALAATGHPRKAVRLGREAVALADGIDDLLMQGESRIDLAEVLLGAARTEQADATLREGVRLLDRKGAVLAAANARRSFAELLTDAGAGGAATAAPLHRRA